MSFLAGRIAGKEGAYFFQESKQAVTRYVEKHKITPTQKIQSQSPPSSAIEFEENTDVLPEVLKHNLPLKIFRYQPPSDPDISTASKWVLRGDPNKVFPVSADALNPLRAYVSLPQVTFGPKRWDMPNIESSVSASTANELRRDRHTPINPEKLKAAAEGLSHIGKAFAVATAAIFGGGALIFGFVVSKLELHNSDDIRTKGRDLVQPKLDTVREQLVPIRTWAENMSRRWQVDREQNIKDKPLIIQELSKILGAKSSSN